jgi:hypothetical protein
MYWIQKNFKTIVYISFLVPILLVAFVSISHVTTWYGLSNPMTWAIYLSVGIEIAALSALAAISAQMGSKVYFPFGIVTLIQFIGNIFFAYQYIDVNSEQFKDWVDLVDPIVSYLGVESGNIVSHKRFLALFAGGMLPIISLSFLHMLVKFEEEDKKKRELNLTQPQTNKIDIEELSKTIAREDAKEYEEKYTPTEEELKKLEEELKRINERKFGSLIQDKDIEVVIDEQIKDEDVKIEEDVVIEEQLEEDIKNEDILIEEEFKPEDVVEEKPEEEVKDVFNTENVILEGINGESIINESIADINVEPDFYIEEEPDYSLEDESNSSEPIKRLSYFRSR